ncbi:MAG: hypothetical protein ABW089_06770 [Sedimenticola sp.]
MTMNQSPPSLTEFNSQVADLVERLGAGAFCASPGQHPEYTLFVENNQVIAEPRSAPRHPYGVYCSISAGLSAEKMAERLNKWLTTGEAYQEFLAMNVCRYNC